MKYATLLIMLWTASSLSGCSKITRPDAYACIVNVPGAEIDCHNLKNDYDNKGNLLKVKVKNQKTGLEEIVTIPKTIIRFGTPDEMLQFLNKGTWTSEVGAERIKIYVGKVRAAFDD